MEGTERTWGILKVKVKDGGGITITLGSEDEEKRSELRDAEETKLTWLDGAEGEEAVQEGYPGELHSAQHSFTTEGYAALRVVVTRCQALLGSRSSGTWLPLNTAAKL